MVGTDASFSNLTLQRRWAQQTIHCRSDTLQKYHTVIISNPKVFEQIGDFHYDVVQAREDKIKQQD